MSTHELENPLAVSPTGEAASGRDRAHGALDRTRALFASTNVPLTAIALGVMVTSTITDANGVDRSTLTLVVLLLVGWAPLLVRSRWPFAVLAVVAAVECFHLALVPLVAPVQFNSAPVAVMVAAFEIGARADWRRAWLAVGAVAALVLVVGIVNRPAQLAANMFALDLILAATGAGVLLRSRYQRLLAMQERAERAEATREEAVQREVTAERVRMARELHDVVAHHLTLVNAQAGVAEYLVRTDPDAAATALRGIADNSRGALDELRATVSLLRNDATPDSATGDGEALRPLPGLNDLGPLVDAHRATGADIELAFDGATGRASSMVDLAGYRIVQEALTNAAKHAPGAPVEVRVAWSDGELAVDVTNGCAATPNTDAPGTGHGLIGMRERALAARGRLDAGPTSDGGFRVDAVLPVAPRVEGRS